MKHIRIRWFWSWYDWSWNVRDQTDGSYAYQIFALKCALCRSFTWGCGKPTCHIFCGTCPKCLKLLEEDKERCLNAVFMHGDEEGPL